MAKKDKKNKSSKSAGADKKAFFSQRQKTVLLFVLVAMFLAVPVVDNFRCKAACLKKVKTIAN
jgi:hypothetical protein